MTIDWSSAATINRLQDVLSKSEAVNRFNADEHLEAGVLAHALADVAASCEVLLVQLLPKLLDSEGSSAKDVLLDIGEELRHILYHVGDSRYYDYLPMERGKR